MNTDGRPTLRCLSEDLPNDWGSAEDQTAVQRGRIETPLPALNHPIIRKVASDFPAVRAEPQPARESISGLSDPVWWKAKIGGRWRGAVWEDPETGQAWLCAAGYRREREATDFYKNFMGAVGAKGAAPFLPTAEDRERLKRELRSVKLDTWASEIQGRVRALAIELWNEAGESHLEVVHPGDDEQAIARITVSIAREELDGEVLVELVVAIECLDYQHLPLVQWAELVTLSAIDRREQRWRSLPVGGVPTHSQVLDGDEIAFVSTGMQTSATPGAFEIGDTAHFTHRGRLVESIVEGEGVKALCGAFFVPRQDHEDMTKCPHCSAIHKALPD